MSQPSAAPRSGADDASLGLAPKVRRLLRASFDALSRPPVWITVLVACSIVDTALQTYETSIIGGRHRGSAAAELGIALAALAAMFAAARRPGRFPTINPAVLPWLAGALCLLVGWLAGTFWPNSGDEHSYVFLADTLLAGRLSNPPAPDPELFAQLRVFTMHGHTFSQYLPGWPLVLAPFRFGGVEWLANPLLTVVLGISLLGAMRRLRVAAAVQPVMLLLVMASPFVLFNGASLFSSTLSATLAMALAWQQIADEERPSTWRKALIGVLFGAQLLTRFEIFLLLAALYAGDRLWRRRGAAFADAAPILLGASPLVAFFFLYNWTITGDPVQTPVTFANPDVALGAVMMNPWVMVERASQHMVYWTGALGQFGGLALAVLQRPALAAKAKNGSLRFFDLALPATIGLFLLFPHWGGHQYGPRYWFPAWPLAALTVASGLLESDGAFRLDGRRLNFDRLTAAALVFYSATLPGLIATTRVYIDARREVLADPVPAKPAVVLVPSRELRLWPWQAYGLHADSADFERGDVDFSGPVLYGRLDAPDAVARACRLPGRAVFIWRGPGNLARADCPSERNKPQSEAMRRE